MNKSAKARPEHVETEQWFLFQYQNGKVAALSKGFKTKQLAEKARSKYTEPERKKIGVGVVRVEL